MCTVWKNLSCNEGGSTLECFLFWVNFLDKIPLRCIHWNLDFCHWFFWTVQDLWEPTVMRGNSLPWLHYSSTSFKAGRRAKFAHQSANRDLGDFPSLPYQLLRGGQPYGYLLRWGQLCSPLLYLAARGRVPFQWRVWAKKWRDAHLCYLSVKKRGFLVDSHDSHTKK